MIPYAKHSISKNESNKVLEQLKKGSLSRGPILLEFEKKFGKYLNALTVSCSSGSSALEIALRAANIRAGDEIIIPNISWTATATAISLVGAKPVFCDVDTDYPNLSLNEVSKNITPKTKAVIPVHFGGRAIDLKKLYSICSKKKVKIIEDACHAFGGRYKDGSLIGSSKLSFAACFSFHPAKTITTGEGGLITTKQRKIQKKLSIIRSSGIVRNSSAGYYKSHYDCIQLGNNYHMTTLSAAIGLCQLKKTKKFITKRKNLWRRYSKNLRNIKHINLYKHDGNSSYNLCLLSVFKDKKKLIETLTSKGIGVFFHYPEIRKLSIYKKKLLPSVNTDKKFSNSKLYTKNSITLPLFPDMKFDDVDRVSSEIKLFYNKV